VLQAAKDGTFTTFAKLLKSQKHLSFEHFNSLPPGRNFGVLHQIAFHGNRIALEALLNAHPRVDLKFLTKDGKTAEKVAVEEEADASFLDFLRECMRRQREQELVTPSSDEGVADAAAAAVQEEMPGVRRGGRKGKESGPDASTSLRKRSEQVTLAPVAAVVAPAVSAGVLHASRFQSMLCARICH